MNEFFTAASTKAARAWHRTRGAMVRHPWLTAAAVPTLAVVYVLALIPLTPSIGDIKKVREEQPTVVLSADGKELAVFKRANRDWVKLADISPKVVDALLATEDHRFHDHIGLDFKRTGMAVLNTLKGDREGGSTITQQLARNLYPEEIGRAPTISRKLKEAITALKLEAVYSKEEILETYLNSVSFLYNAWGIEMAARTYFDKSAKQLDELEAATLIGMLKGTSYYNPVLNPERALQRRNLVLAQLVRHEKLSQERYAQMKQQPLRLDFERLPEVTGPAPHLAEHLRRWLFEWADRGDYNVYADGLVVRTTIDSRLQTIANEAVKRQGDLLQAVADVEWSRSGLAAHGTDPKNYAAQRGKAPAFEHFWNSKKNLVDDFIQGTPEYRALRAVGRDDAEAIAQLREDAAFMRALRESKTRLQAGFMAMEPSTGHVRAWVGSRDYNDDKFDHVQQARRQPGSTFKPFVYGAAFEQGMLPNQTFMDAPVEIQIDKNKVWRPSDVGAGPSNQPMTLREGLARSKNTITAQVMMQVGPTRVASLARAMGVRQSKLDEVPSLALGTSPVTLKEVVSSFGTIANGGNYIPPVLVTSIEDRNGSTLEAFASLPSEAALSSQAAMTLIDVLRGVVDEGTAVGLRHRFGISGDVAGKTGTTNDNTDGWFILMHPQLVAGAWVGFNDNRVTMRSEYWGQGAHNALLVVGDFFQTSFKQKALDPKAVFSAPRQKDLEQPMLQRMNDWFNSVFVTPAEPDATVVASPPPVEPPVLIPPPVANSAPMPASAYPAPPSDGVVVIDNQRVPSFPRPLEPAVPAATVPGTQVQGLPAELARVPEMGRPRARSGDFVRGPQPPVTEVVPRAVELNPRGPEARPRPADPAPGSSAEVVLVPRPWREVARSAPSAAAASPPLVAPTQAMGGSSTTPGSAAEGATVVRELAPASGGGTEPSGAPTPASGNATSLRP